jgi:protein AFG1
MLYKNGIQRASFIPCIEMLKSRFDVINLDSGTGNAISPDVLSTLHELIRRLIVDYRRIPRALSNVYYHPLTKENSDEVDKIFDALATKDGEEAVHDRRINIWGRTLRVPESTSHVAKFSFEELCGRPLSAADYIEVTKTFKTVFVTDVPKMDLNAKDKARRFITFIDGKCVSTILSRCV